MLFLKLTDKNDKVKGKAQGEKINYSYRGEIVGGDKFTVKADGCGCMESSMNLREYAGSCGIMNRHWRT